LPYGQMNINIVKFLFVCQNVTHNVNVLRMVEAPTLYRLAINSYWIPWTNNIYKTIFTTLQMGRCAFTKNGEDIKKRCDLLDKTFKMQRMTSCRIEYNVYPTSLN
jgi:hypothetical protein